MHTQPSPQVPAIPLPDPPYPLHPFPQATPTSGGALPKVTPTTQGGVLTEAPPRPGPSKPLPSPRLRPIACQSPLLLPSGPRSTVHSSMTPKGWKSLSTSSSDCCLLSMPTNSFRSPVGGVPAHGPAEPALGLWPLSPDPCCPRTFAQATLLPVAPRRSGMRERGSRDVGRGRQGGRDGRLGYSQNRERRGLLPVPIDSQDRVTRTGNAGLYRAPMYTGRPNSFAHTSPHALSLQPSGTREGTGKVWGVRTPEEQTEQAGAPTLRLQRPRPRGGYYYLHGSHCLPASPGSAAPSVERENRVRVAEDRVGCRRWVLPFVLEHTQATKPSAGKLLASLQNAMIIIPPPGLSLEMTVFPPALGVDFALRFLSSRSQSGLG